MRRLVGLGVVLALAGVACGTRASDAEFDAVLKAGAGGIAAADRSASSSRSDGEARLETATDADGGWSGAIGPAGARGGQATGPAGAGGASPANGAGGGGGGGAGGAGPTKNIASDVGVTEDTIKVGSVVSVNGPLGPRQFSPTFFGMNAYVSFLNSQGGVNGRRIELVTCDDRESEEENRRCAERLIEQEKVFALLGNNTRVWDTGAAKYTHDKGVPVVGGLTIGLSQTYFPTIFDFYVTADAGYPRDFKVGQDGQTFSSNAQCIYWSRKGVKKAGVIFYSIPISKEAGLNIKSCLEDQQIDVATYEINPAVPNWDAVSADMQQRGITAAFDTVDIVANQNLCRALDRRGYRLDFKVSTVAVQARWVKNDFSHPCRESIFIPTIMVPLAIDHPETNRFRDVMARLYNGRFDDELHQWSFDAWLAGIQFKEAIESMGANVTRQGLMDWYNALDHYDCHGLCRPLDYSPETRQDGQQYETCFGLVRWDERTSEYVFEADFRDPANCFAAKWIAAPASYSP